MAASAAWPLSNVWPMYAFLSPVRSLVQLLHHVWQTYALLLSAQSIVTAPVATFAWAQPVYWMGAPTAQLLHHVC